MIITNNTELLRINCQPVNYEEVDGLISMLDDELKKSALMGRPGIGLAAAQTGIYKQAAIVRINNYYSVNLINCKITNSYDEFIFEDEGCLSFPDVRVNTKRFNEIHITDNLVAPHSFVATGLFAVAIQHELDHMNGIILTDRKVVPIIKQKPNELCLCKSGIKFKKCCYLKM